MFDIDTPDISALEVEADLVERPFKYSRAFSCQRSNFPQPPRNCWPISCLVWINITHQDLCFFYPMNHILMVLYIQSDSSLGKLYNFKLGGKSLPFFLSIYEFVDSKYIHIRVFFEIFSRIKVMRLTGKGVVFINDHNIDNTCLNRSKLPLNKSGTSLLIKKFSKVVNLFDS